MTVVVRRRSLEIAVLKTIGVQGDQIMLMFLVESGLLAPAARRGRSRSTCCGTSRGEEMGNRPQAGGIFAIGRSVLYLCIA